MKHFRRLSANPLVSGALILVLIATSCQTHEKTVAQSYSGEDLFKGIFLLQGAVADQISVFKKTKANFPMQGDADAQLQYNQIVDEVVEVIRTNNPQFFNAFRANIQSGDHLRVAKTLDEALPVLHFSLMKSPTISKYYADALAFAQTIDTKGLIGSNGELNYSKVAEINSLINEKSQKGNHLLSSRQEGCSAVFFCVAWIYLAVWQSAAFAVSVAAAVAVALWAGVYVWVAATVQTPTPQPKTFAEDPNLAAYEFYQPTQYDILQQEMLIDEITMKMAIE